ncbi:MAG: DUF934 domain-containing protein [Gammaproteobacteria bacterium]|jgi:uncharacterized protein (DUF934 family)|nr:DUF934 domain-containing protein [Gammaproteobacteria bacterium]
MALIRNGALARDSFKNAAGRSELPDHGAVLVGLDQWREHRDPLLRRGERIGLLLLSDQHPEAIAADVHYFDLIALEFPGFRDGRAYSYARLLRERFKFTGELRAVGDVLLEQLHYMHRVGFNSFDLDSRQPLEEWKTAAGEFSVWYQPTADGRATATELRHWRNNQLRASAI